MENACPPMVHPEDLDFQRYTRRFWPAQWLYHNCYRLYSPLYTLYKITSDRFALDLFRQHVEPGATVLDIGANIGIITTCLAQMVGAHGQVHAFEPEPRNFDRLRKRTQAHPNVIVYRTAVASRSGLMTLYKSAALNVDHRLYDDGTGRSGETVQALAVDDQFKDIRVNLVKIDIQGFEYEALLGMRQTLNNNPDLNLYLECWPYGLKCAGSSVEQILDFLQSAGFNIRIADLKKRCLLPITHASGQWRNFENKPRVDFNLWCSKTPSTKTVA